MPLQLKRNTTLKLGEDVFLYSIQSEINDLYLVSKRTLEDEYASRYLPCADAEKDMFVNNEDAIFERMISYTNILIERVRASTKMNLEEFHKEWIESIAVNALFCIVPTNSVLRRNIANKFGIGAINKWAFAYWPRRTGKSYNTAMPIVAFLFSIPGGNAALQSINLKSASQTMEPFQTHVINLFDYLGVDKKFDPILSFNNNGMRFVNWYGAQLLMTGKYNSVISLPPHCYGRVMVLSGNSNSARGITVHMYICDEERFVREHAKINLMMGTKRVGTIFVAMSSQDPEDHNVTVENLQTMTDIVSLSVYETRCPECRQANIDECPHRNNPEWIGDIGPFEKVTNAIVHESGKSILNTELNNYKSNFTEGAISVPEKASVQDWKVAYLPVFEFLLCGIDPATNQGKGSKFTSTIMGASKPDRMTPGLSSFIFLDTLEQNGAIMSVLCGNVIKQVFAFRERHPDLRYHMIIFVPENNQGVLPSELARALVTTTSDRPTRLCNWIIYAERPIVNDTSANGYTGGICATNPLKTKAATNIHRLMNQNPPFPCFRFYVSVPDVVVSSFLNECTNEVKEIDMSDNSAISFHTKPGQTNDKLNTVYDIIAAFYRYKNNVRVRDCCYQKTMICGDRQCRFAATGHPIH